MKIRKGFEGILVLWNTALMQTNIANVLNLKKKSIGFFVWVFLVVVFFSFGVFFRKVNFLEFLF